MPRPRPPSARDEGEADFFGRREPAPCLSCRSKATPMKRPLLVLLLLVGASFFLTSCGTFSSDYAPGGISSTETGLNPYAISQWQDRSIRQLAY